MVARPLTEHPAKLQVHGAGTIALNGAPVAAITANVEKANNESVEQ